MLWPFNHYPGTDYETFNWDWLIGLGKKMEKALHDLFSDTGALHQMVDKVLGEHPEWVTTVMDGAITENKIYRTFLTMIKNFYTTPEEFDAVGDGETDDTLAIQNALNDARPVLFTKTYKITNGLISNRNKKQLYGIHLGKIFLDANIQNALLTINGDNTLMRGLEIYSDPTYFNGGVTVSAAVVGCKAIDNNVHDFGYYGLNGFSEYRNNVLSNCCSLPGETNGHGAIFSGNDNVIIEGNDITVQNGDGLDHAIYCGGSHHHDIVIRNNKLKADVGSTTGPLIACYPSSSEEMPHDNVIIEGNIIDYRNHTGEGRAAVVAKISNSIIRDNVIIGEGSSDASLWIYNSDNTVIDGNEIEDTRLQVSDSNNIVFKNNNVKCDGRITGDTHDILFEDNIFSSATSTPAVIRLTDPGYNVKVLKNAFMNAAFEVSPETDGSHNININDNEFYDVDRTAIYIRRATQCTVNNNKIICNDDTLENSRGINMDISDTDSICIRNECRGVALQEYTFSANMIRFDNVTDDTRQIGDGLFLEKDPGAARTIDANTVTDGVVFCKNNSTNLPYQEYGFLITLQNGNDRAQLFINVSASNIPRGRCYSRANNDTWISLA